MLFVDMEVGGVKWIDCNIFSPAFKVSSVILIFEEKKK